MSVAFLFALALISTPRRALLLLAMLVYILAVVTQRQGSFLYSRTAGALTFRQSWGVRALIPLVLSWGVLAAGVVLLHRIPFLLLLACVALFFVLLQGFGPNQITFNTEERSYRWLMRWFWSARVRTGLWSEFAGVRVRHSYTKGVTTYTVSLTYSHDPSFGPILGRFSKRERAEDMAGELAQTLGLPCVQLPSKHADLPTRQSA